MNRREMSTTTTTTMPPLRIPNTVKTMWNEWNLRGAVLLSLFLQILLVFIAPLRKRSRSTTQNVLIWGAYLLADWVAAFAVGLASSAVGDDSTDKHLVNKDLASFWAPFLLLHLGGPDTITAFSLEDNELWIRHLLGLLLQLFSVVYVFSQSIPNQFWVPTVLISFAGTIKYAERTCALCKACLENFKSFSMVSKPGPEPNVQPIKQEHERRQTTATPLNEIEVVQNASKWFGIVKAMIVDLMLSSHQLREGRKFFIDNSCENVFKVMEMELNFMYDALYTKNAVVHCKIGYFFLFICFVLIAVSFERFVSHHKHGLHRYDIAVTYTLLVGAVGLDFIAIVKLIFSDWTIGCSRSIPAPKKLFLRFGESCLCWVKHTSGPILSRSSLISYSLHQRLEWFNKAAEMLGFRDFLDEIQHKRTKRVEDNLKELIFQKIGSARSNTQHMRRKPSPWEWGTWNIHKSYMEKAFPKNIEASEREYVEYDERLLLWHVATELCYFTSFEEELLDENRKTSKLLSDYMLYLLIMRPRMMSAVVGIRQTRFRDTCKEAKNIIQRVRHLYDDLNVTCPNIFLSFEKLIFQGRGRRRRESDLEKTFCEVLLADRVEVKGDTLLLDACVFVRELKKMESMWKMLSERWIVFLIHAATHSRGIDHARLLSKGGELITFVWQLLVHLDFEELFPKGSNLHVSMAKINERIANCLRPITLYIDHGDHI